MNLQPWWFFIAAATTVATAARFLIWGPTPVGWTEWLVWVGGMWLAEGARLGVKRATTKPEVIRAEAEAEAIKAASTEQGGG